MPVKSMYPYPGCCAGSGSARSGPTFCLESTSISTSEYYQNYFGTGPVLSRRGTDGRASSVRSCTLILKYSRIFVVGTTCTIGTTAVQLY